MSTRLWLIRHGPTHQSGMIGWSDVPADLSDHKRIAALEARLPDGPIISSDLIRAHATATAVQGTRRRLPDDPNLREMNFGVWEGHTFSEISAQSPALARDFWANPGDHAPQDGESWNAFSSRVREALIALCAAHADEDLIIVAHFGVIVAALQWALALENHAAMRFSIDNLSLTRIDKMDGGFRVSSVNQT